MAWPGAQPSPSGRGGVFAAQEPEPSSAATEGEDELTPPKPFYFDADANIAQEEGTSINQIHEPSPTHVPEETQLFGHVKCTGSRK